jgi:hypothetical protein
LIFRSESGRPWHPAEAALWLALYGLVATWLTWPLLPNVASHLPVPNSFNPFDSPRLAWALAWQRAADGGHPNLELVARDGTELLFEVHDAIPEAAIDP